MFIHSSTFCPLAKSIRHMIQKVDTVVQVAEAKYLLQMMEGVRMFLWLR